MLCAEVKAGANLTERAREAVDLPLTGKVAATEWLTERENP